MTTLKGGPLRRIEDFRSEGVIGAAAHLLSYTAPAVLVWPQAVVPAARELRDSAADLVLSTNGLTR
ncbi:MAG: hypothetical protein M3271_04560 [Actinomycetota bacterium]|nr:hypothetical protein [Actinomycetota bacterium]